MKKICILTFPLYILLCAILLALSCAAMMGPFPDDSCEDYGEYKKLLRDNSPPEAFVTYDRLCFLGEFQYFSSYDHYDEYSYTLLTSNGEKLYAKFNMYPIERSGELVPALPYTELVNENDLTLIDTNAIEKRLGIDLNSDFHNYYVYMEIEGAVYYYLRTGNLICIKLNQNGGSCVIQTAFERCDPKSLLGKLLKKDTVAEGMAEFEARFSGNYRNPWKKPVAVAVVSLVAVSTLIAYAVMRKRAENAHRLGANDGNSNSA
jgi:hypothetical protein